MSLTIGSLFSGIGGLELGLEMAGLGPVLWQCEVDPFCRRVLAKHWPNVERFNDVTQPRLYPHVDLICGGFPCQNLSSAGKREGLSGAKSGLWYHYASIVEKVRPRFVVVENVASGAKNWLPTVRRQLHLLGYDSTAYALSAADVGALHRRGRLFVVADAERVQLRVQPGRREGASRGNSVLARVTREARGVARTSGRLTQPSVDRAGDGVSRRLDAPRLKALGNAVVPACSEVIGRIVMEMAR